MNRHYFVALLLSINKAKAKLNKYVHTFRDFRRVLIIATFNEFQQFFKHCADYRGDVTRTNRHAIKAGPGPSGEQRRG